MDTKLTNKQKELYINITDDFKGLYNSLNFEDKLAADIFKIFDKYLKYDIAGLFFNESDESSRNVFNMNFPVKKISMKLVEQIRDKFFDVAEKYKRINEIQCNLIEGNIDDKSKLTLSKLKTFEIIPFVKNEKLLGGLFIASTQKLKKEDIIILDFIKKELTATAEIKYLINHQKNNSLKDSMTGLYSRQYFDEMLNLEFNKARRYIYNFSLAILDIDYLSKINEKYGREYGDYVLQELSNLLKRVFRRTDPIFRYGSEEIIVYLPYTPITKAIIPIERLRNEISKYVFEKDNKKTNITVSIGICANYSQFTEPEQMIEKLGKALMDAKNGGRNQVGLYE